MTNETSLFQILPEPIANALARSVRPITTLEQLLESNHRDILIARNCGWGTLRQIQRLLSDRDIRWPGYEVPYPQPGSGGRDTTPRGADGFVYLAQTKSHRLTKVGFSTTPEVREQTLQGEDPFFHTIFSTRAPASFERWLHERFAPARHRGEWFALTRDEIDWLKVGTALADYQRKEFHGLLTPKTLADALGKHRNYVDAMKRNGFSMPGGTATLAEARAWLARNPPPRSRRGFKAAA